MAKRTLRVGQAIGVSALFVLALGLFLFVQNISGGPGAVPLQPGTYEASWKDTGEITVARAIIHDDNNPLFGGWAIDRNSRRVTFNARCNEMQAQITRQGIGPIASQLASCQQSFDPILRENLDNGEFSIVDDSSFIAGDLLFTWRVPLGEVIPFEGNLLDGEYEGVLAVSDGATASPLQIATATLLNDGTMASFFAGCNRLRAPVTDSGLGPIASTRMLCPDDSNENLLLAHLDSGNFVKRSDSSFSVGDIVFRRVR